MSSGEFHNAPGRVMFRKIGRLLQLCLSFNVMLHPAARYLVGALSFSPILKIGPIPTRATPWIHAPVPSRASLPLAPQPRARTLRTLLGYQLPPRAVATPRVLRASAMARSVVAPDFCACLTIGRMLPAKRSASDLIMRRRPARRPGHDETLAGGYQHCAEKHLHRDLSEFDFRYSNRMALGVNDRN